MIDDSPDRQDRTGLNLWISTTDLFVGVLLIVLVGAGLVVQRSQAEAANLRAKLQQLGATSGKSQEDVRFSHELAQALNAATRITSRIKERMQDKLGGPDDPKPEYSETQIAIPSGALFPSFSFEFEQDLAKQQLLRRIGGAIMEGLGSVSDDDRQVVRLVIEGHTDSDPILPSAITREIPTNWELSSRRATGVLRFFIEHLGMDPAHYKLMAIGMGDRSPIESNDTPTHKAQNRRITFRVEPEVMAIRARLSRLAHPRS